MSRTYSETKLIQKRNVSPDNAKYEIRRWRSAGGNLWGKYCKTRQQENACQGMFTDATQQAKVASVNGAIALPSIPLFDLRTC